MITYQVNMTDLKEIEDALGMVRDKSKLVLRSALNETAKEVRVLLADEAAKEYVMRRSAFVKNMNIDKAKSSNLVATIHSSGTVNELYDFKVQPRKYVHPLNFAAKPSQYKGQVRQNRALSSLILRPGNSNDQYKAFVVKYRSGHITVGQRVPGKRMKSKPEKEFVKTLLSPSIPKMLGNENTVYGVVQPVMHRLLLGHIQTQMQKFLR